MRLMLIRAMRPTEPQAFDILRIGLSLVLIARVLVETPTLFVLYGRYGIMRWPVNEALLDAPQPRLSWLLEPAQRLGISADTALLLLVSIYLACLILLALGLGSRFSAALAWFCHAMMVGSTQIAEYGIDSFATSGLFYCALAPAGRLSLDHLLLGKEVKATYWATAILRLLQLQLCFVYFDSGIIKAIGPQWWNGEAIWLVLQHHDFHGMGVTGSWDWSKLAQYPWIPQATGWGVVILETTYPFVMPFAIRRFWIGLTILMHVCIALFLGLWFFTGVMIAFNLAGFSRLRKI